LIVTLIVSTKDDDASRNIASTLLKEYPFEETSEKFHGNPVYRWISQGREMRLLTVEGEMVYLQELENLSNVEIIVFVSRHESRNGRPILSVHVPGNFSTAEFGGLPEKLSIAPANAMRAALKDMAQQRIDLGLKEFEVYYEGTHHGPSINRPSLFVEIGSTPQEWNNPLAGKAVAHAAITAIQNTLQVMAAVGMGGSHCNRRLTNISLEFDVAFGHIIPSYAFKWLSPEILKQCVDKTLEKNPAIVIDWKGIDGKDRDNLQRILDSVPYQVRRAAEYRE